MSDTNSPTSLIGQTWLHSHEEDVGEDMVFRPAAYSFSRSRGRSGYGFHADGTLAIIGPSPEDKESSTSGHWELHSDNELEIAIPGQEPLRLTIVSFSGDKLILRRKSPANP